MKTISFIIPVYNEAKRLDKTFEALKSVVLPKGLALEQIIFVNDGSTDNTVSRIKYFVSSMNKKGNIPNTKYQILSCTTNRGKGYAVKQGMLANTSDYALFFDADMSTPLTELAKFAPFINQNIDVIVGTRKNGHSTVIKHQPKIRELLGKGFTKTTKLALGLNNLTDFTCGFKAFSRNAAKEVFTSSIIDRWGYDAEILFLSKKYGFSMVEKAVMWSNDERTKVKLYKAVPQTLLELATIRYNHSIKPTFTTPFVTRSSATK